MKNIIKELLMLVSVMSVTAFAAEGDVAGCGRYLDCGTQTDQVGCLQGHFPDHRPRPRRAVFRKGFDCIPRLPQARAVRMDSSGNSSRHPGILTDLPALHLGDTWIKTRAKK